MDHSGYTIFRQSHLSHKTPIWGELTSAKATFTKLACLKSIAVKLESTKLLSTIFWGAKLFFIKLTSTMLQNLSEPTLCL